MVLSTIISTIQDVFAKHRSYRHGYSLSTDLCIDRNTCSWTDLGQYGLYRLIGEYKNTHKDRLEELQSLLQER